MTRIMQIMAAVGKAGLADWDEIHAIVAAVESIANEAHLSMDTFERFKTQYGTLAVETLDKLNTGV